MHLSHRSCTCTIGQVHLLVLYKIQILIFTDHLPGVALLHHEKTLHKSSSKSHAHFMHTKVLQIKLAGISVWLSYSLHLLYLLLLQIVFAITQNQLVIPKMFVSTRASTLIKQGYTQMLPGLLLRSVDYLGQ